MKYPAEIEKIRNICMCCHKPHNTHMVCGGCVVQTMKSKIIGKTIHLYTIYAPLGCYLAHEKKSVMNFYADKDWFGWKVKK